jgi:carboxyl-terminal processing protease
MEIGEEHLEHSLPWDTIKPTPHEFFSDTAQFVPELNQKSGNRRLSENEFKILATNIERFRKMRENKAISLNENKRWDLYKEEKKISEQQYSLMKLDDPSLDEKGTGKDKSKKPGKDIFLEESSRILSDYINLQSFGNKAVAITPK